MRGIWKENPVLIQLLGLCPALAVTNTVENSLAMGLATFFVLICASFLVSLLKSFIPKEVRISAYILIIATFVTVVDYLIQAVSLALYDALGAFIQLIVVNCVILGRAEAHASKNPPLPAMINALGMSLGFTIGLFALGAVREILGAGSLFGVSLFGANFQPWVVMVLPPGGFFVIGLWLLAFAAWGRYQQRKLAEAARHG
jgi:electron transport complex protein RnfE